MRLLMALAVYAVLAYAAARTLTAKIPVGDHPVELRVVVWIILGAFAVLTVLHRNDRAGSAEGGDK